MTSVRARSPPAHVAANHAAALARHAVARRQHSATPHIARRRRQPTKPADSLELLAVVVGAVHSAPKFMCPLCASTFGRRCELKRHVAEVHTLAGARRFACKHPACGKSFTRKDALAKHEIVKHQGKRRFECPTCSEKFTSRYDLSRHNVRVHSNVKKRFTCEFCAAGFSQKSQLTMHKGRVHSQGKTPFTTPSVSRSQTPDRAEGCASMDSLAAVAVALAEEEEKLAGSKASNSGASLAVSHSRPGPPSQKRAAGDTIVSPAHRVTSKEEAAAATFAADKLLEAAAALQPRSVEPPCTIKRAEGNVARTISPDHSNVGTAASDNSNQTSPCLSTSAAKN